MTGRERIEAALPLVAEWYSASRRVLPWREAPTPYQVWISEIMLQQTRIEAVIPYYRRFLEELPNPAALAAVEEDRLLKLWEGLGYYSRARNLKKAAQQLMEQYGGVLPREAAELKKLPGIGDYTAGAIASIAYGEPAPAVDGNVLRVMTRLLACAEDIALPGTKTKMTGLLAECYPSGERAALVTEGLMELGETLCVPKGEARCERCPLRGLCLARLTEQVERYPVKSPPRTRRILERTILLLRCDGAYAIRRRPSRGLLAGLWEFPGLEGRFAEEELRALLRQQGIEALSLSPCGEAKHVFTHVEWRMRGYIADCADRSGDYLWARPEEIRAEYSIPTALRFYLDQI